MRAVITTNTFEKDVKRIKKRKYALDKLSQIIRWLASGTELAPQYRDHALRGNYVGFRECHVEPDWLLIYQLTETELALVRTGTHADLFK